MDQVSRLNQEQVSRLNQEQVSRLNLEPLKRLRLFQPEGMTDPEGLAEWEALKKEVAKGLEEGSAEMRLVYKGLAIQMDIDHPSSIHLLMMKGRVKRAREEPPKHTMDWWKATFKVEDEAAGGTLLQAEEAMKTFLASGVEFLEKAGEYGLEQIKAYKEKHNLEG